MNDIWESGDDVLTVEGVTDRLLSMYDVESQELTNDVQASLEMLAEFGFLTPEET